MNNCLYVFLSLLAATNSAVRAADGTTKYWGPISNNVQMSIALNSVTSQIHSNQQVALLIRIKNLSARDIGYYDAAAQNTHPYAGVKFIVISPSGKEISLNTDGRYGGSGALRIVPPGKTNAFEFNLTRFFKLDEVGTYNITAQKIISLYTNKSCEVTSNPLNVAVVPTAGSDRRKGPASD